MVSGHGIPCIFIFATINLLLVTTFRISLDATVDTGLHKALFTSGMQNFADG